MKGAQINSSSSHSTAVRGKDFLHSTSNVLTDKEKSTGLKQTQGIETEKTAAPGKYSVFVIADWFLKKAKKAEITDMTNKKLQKLCYYAQAWCYALRGYRLENTDFEAWVHGPVSPALWRKYKSFGFGPITTKNDSNPQIDDEDIKLLEDVWDTYGHITSSALEVLTHRELPWQEARIGYRSEESCRIPIKPGTMASFYKSIYCGD